MEKVIRLYNDGIVVANEQVVGMKTKEITTMSNVKSFIIKKWLYLCSWRESWHPLIFWYESILT